MFATLPLFFKASESEALTPQDDPRLAETSAHAEQTIARVSTIVLGKSRQIRLAVACMLAGGHLLLEDVPGVGKTTLAHALKQAFGLHFARVQFTSDFLPGDILGSSIYNKETQHFDFHPGPVFTQLLLADEINRSSPKAQSALLESMEEGQVTIDGATHALPKPFFVIATQNPSHQLGTFPLPESQLDRFLMCISLGYPDAASEKSMLLGQNPREKLEAVLPAFELQQLLDGIENVKQVHASEALVDYVYRIVAATRTGSDFDEGLSPRCALGLLNAARAWALMEGRQAVLPDDIQAVYPSVANHRLRCKTTQGGLSRQPESYHAAWLKKIHSEV